MEVFTPSSFGHEPSENTTSSRALRLTILKKIESRASFRFWMRRPRMKIHCQSMYPSFILTAQAGRGGHSCVSLTCSETSKESTVSLTLSSRLSKIWNNKNCSYRELVRTLTARGCTIGCLPRPFALKKSSKQVFWAITWTFWSKSCLISSRTWSIMSWCRTQQIHLCCLSLLSLGEPTSLWKMLVKSRKRISISCRWERKLKNKKQRKKLGRSTIIARSSRCDQRNFRRS